MDSLITYFSPPTIQTPEVIIYSPAPPDQKLDTVNALYSTYIRGLWFHADTHTGDKSTYQTTRKSIIDAYANGDRSSNLMRAYIYLLTQEWNFISFKSTVFLLGLALPYNSYITLSFNPSFN